MAISTYAELQSAVAKWLERTGDTTVTGNVADFITLAESRINRDLRLNAVEASAPLTGSTSSRILTPPSGVVAPIALYLTTYGTQDYLRPFVQGSESMGTINGVPSAWSWAGDVIWLDEPCDQAHTFTFRYQGTFALSDSATTNALLTAHPDVYLFASLVEVNAFLQDPQTAALWDARYRAAIDEINAKENRAKSRAPLIVDAALRHPGGYNINSDV